MLYCTSWSSDLERFFFSDQDINKCLTNLFLVVEQTNRISLASFSDLQSHACDQLCCLGGVFKSFAVRLSVSVYTIYS